MCVGMSDVMCFFVIKQKTAYELRISDWSSDFCASDLQHLALVELQNMGRRAQVADIVDDAALTDPRRIGGTVEHRIIHPFVRHVEDISRRQRVGDQRPEDRKSTRLNSSH